MASTTIGTEIHKALDIHGDFSPEISLYDKRTDLFSKFLQVPPGQISYFDRRLYTRLRTNLKGSSPA
jgi:hypothetical protein